MDYQSEHVCLVRRGLVWLGKTLRMHNSANYYKRVAKGSIVLIKAMPLILTSNAVWRTSRVARMHGYAAP